MDSYDEYSLVHRAVLVACVAAEEIDEIFRVEQHGVALLRIRAATLSPQRVVRLEELLDDADELPHADGGHALKLVDVAKVMRVVGIDGFAFETFFARSTANFLHIVANVPRRREVDNVFDVVDVDTHAKGFRREHKRLCF